MASLDDRLMTEDEYVKKHPIMAKKLVKTRRIAGIIGGAAVAIGLFAATPVDLSGIIGAGICAGIASRQLFKMHQQRKIGLKKHNIVKRVLYGKDENRPTLLDRVALVAAVAPTAITFITGASIGTIPMIAGISAYVGKRIYNHAKYKKQANTEEMTR